MPRLETAWAKRRGLRAYLVALVLAVLLPALALGAATAWHMAGNYRAAFEERLSATAQALALALDREVQAHIAALTTLAASPRLDGDDLAGFYPHARGAAEALGTPIALIGADLRQRLHTERPFGTPLPVTGAPEAVRRALETGRPAVSDLLTGAVLRTPVVAVMVPVVRGGRADAVLSAPVDPGRLSALLASQGLRGGAFATLIDAKDVVVARSHDPAAALGRPVLDWFPKASGGREAGLLKGRAMVGHDVVLAFRRLANAPGLDGHGGRAAGGLRGELAASAAGARSRGRGELHHRPARGRVAGAAHPAPGARARPAGRGGGRQRRRGARSRRGKRRRWRSSKACGCPCAAPTWRSARGRRRWPRARRGCVPWWTPPWTRSW